MRYGSGTAATFHLPFPGCGYLRRTARTIGRIAEFLKSWEPDIVGLVEIDNGSYLRCARRSQAAELARALGHFHCYRSKYAPGSLVGTLPLMAQQGNALLTRQDIHRVKCHYFRKGIKRLVLDVELPEVQVLIVHLSLKYRHRQEQIEHLRELVAGVRKPVIVAGDFNVFWGMKELSLFLASAGLRSANPSGYPSYPSWAPRHQLDFILHSSDIQVRNFHIPVVHFSDHFPLVCDFAIGPHRGKR
jgi:endonuclease/exonuclease/phosphatase family metal-dependent hydrolase